MTASISTQSTDRMTQICRERSARGVATRTDWQRLAEKNPELARKELISFLRIQQREALENPYDKRSRPRAGLAAGFVVGVLFMSAWWLFGAYLHANVVSSGLQWNLVTLSQYVAASLIPAFAWWGYRVDQRRRAGQEGANTVSSGSLNDASWEELLAMFDATRKAGGTRMY